MKPRHPTQLMLPFGPSYIEAALLGGHLILTTTPRQTMMSTKMMSLFLDAQLNLCFSM